MQFHVVQALWVDGGKVTHARKRRQPPE